MRFAAVFAATAAAAALLVAPSEAAWCNMKSNTTGPMNTIPVDTSTPRFVRAVPNGELYTVGENPEDRIHLLHVYGFTGYDYGYAHGQLLAAEVKDLLTTAYDYFALQVMQAINGTANKYHIPQDVVKKIADIGLDAMLDLQMDIDAKFMSPHIFAEMRGLAAGSGVSYDLIRRVHMFGEVTRGRCSFYGLYNKATLGGKTLQLRALDWDTHAGLQNHPVVVIYHPLSPALGHAFANVGWAGWIGTLTGMSSQQIGISEIGISYPDKTFGDESPVGIPFIFLERQIIQYGTSVFDAMKMITDANRTCRLVLGVADAKAKTARLVQYSHSKVRFFDDKDLEPLEPWHPRIDDAVYMAMDWICPYYQHVMATQLKALHGRITPELSIMNITAPVQTGSLHVAVYDLTDQVLFVANAKGKQDTTGAKDAYARQFLRIDVKAAFSKRLGDM